MIIDRSDLYLVFGLSLAASGSYLLLDPTSIGIALVSTGLLITAIAIYLDIRDLLQE